MIKIYVRFSIRTCKEGNNKISSFYGAQNETYIED